MNDFIFDEAKRKEFVSSVLEKAASFLSQEKPEGAIDFKMIVTTEDTDRMGEIVKLDGWSTENYLLNPVVLLNHDYQALPIAKTTKLYVENGKMIAEGYFAPEEANPVAGQAAKLYALGFLRTASVGFIPTYSKTDKSIIESAELLEWSFVSVPANPQAVTLLGADGVENMTQKGLFIASQKEGEPIETVAEELDEREDREKKWDKFSEVYKIIDAFWEVYFDEETKVEQFDTLLSETVGILTAMIGTKTEDPAMKEMLLAAVKTVEAREKSGKVLSEKNKNVIKEAIAKTGEASTALSALLDLAEEEKSAEEKRREKTDDGDRFVKALLTNQKFMKQLATVANDGLAEMNKVFKK